MDWRMTGGEWKFSLLYYALDTTEIWRIKEYIQRRPATIVEQVACRPIYEMCMGVEKIPVSSRFMMWRDQDVGREI